MGLPACDMPGTSGRDMDVRTLEPWLDRRIVDGHPHSVRGEPPGEHLPVELEPRAGKRVESTLKILEVDEHSYRGAVDILSATARPLRLREKIGGAAWESNPPWPGLPPNTGFEVRAGHQTDRRSASIPARVERPLRALWKPGPRDRASAGGAAGAAHPPPAGSGLRSPCAPEWPGQSAGRCRAGRGPQPE